MNDDTPPDDFDHLVPEPDMVPEPEPPQPAPANFLALNRQLVRFLRDQTPISDQLVTLAAAPQLTVLSGTCAALAAVACGLRYTEADEEDARYAQMLQRAEAGELNRFAPEAADELARTVRIVEKSIAGLEMLDTIMLPLPAQWSNLPPTMLARHINRHCHTLFAGNFLRAKSDGPSSHQTGSPCRSNWYSIEQPRRAGRAALETPPQAANTSSFHGNMEMLPDVGCDLA